MMVIENKYEIGRTVYLITDVDQRPRLVTAIVVNKYDVFYEVTSGTDVSRHYDFEISEEKHLELT